MPLIKDYYKCISVTQNTKKNGDPYLFLRLQNHNTITDAYVWENVSLYKDRIINDGIYAIKYQVDTFNNSSVLNIKNISSVDGDRYKRYGFTKKTVTMSEPKQNQYYFDDISKFILSRDNQSMLTLNDFIINNKKKVLSSDLVEFKYLTLKYFQLIEKTLRSSVDSNLYVYMIVIHGLDLDLENLLGELDNKNTAYDALYLYVNNNKGFIKKYKFIVDFIDYNLKNYINLKKESNNKNGKE